MKTSNASQRKEDVPKNTSLFAWPFKVLRDMFFSPPSAPEPKFTPFDLKVFRAKNFRPLPVKGKKFRIHIWVIEIVLFLIALIIFG